MREVERQERLTDEERRRRQDREDATRADRLAPYRELREAVSGLLAAGWFIARLDQLTDNDGNRARLARAADQMDARYLDVVEPPDPPGWHSATVDLCPWCGDLPGVTNELPFP